MRTTIGSHRAASLIGALLLAASGVVEAQSVDVSPTVYGYAIDGGPDYEWTMDGAFDALYVNTQVVATKSRGLDFTKWREFRGVYEFAIPAVLEADGVTIESAVLHLPRISTTAALYDFLLVHGYAADGVLGLADFEQTADQIASEDIGSSDFDVNVTTYLQGLVGQTEHIGFMLAVSWWDAFVSLEPEAELRIVYSVDSGPVNTPPDVFISTPAGGETFVAGAPVQFAGTAFDQEDGQRNDDIVWYSPSIGTLHTGASFDHVFPPGSFTVTASLTDTAGATTSVAVSFEVAANSVPVVIIQSPLDLAQYTLGDTIGFAAIATDPEDGDVSNEIEWSSSLGGFLGAGPALDVALLASGTHIITATAADALGGEGSDSVSVVLVEPANTPPEIAIQSPSDDATFAVDDLITFSAVASDDEDGDLGAAVNWSSTLSGPIGVGASVSATLPAGTHTIVADVVDLGALSASASITVTVAAAPPVEYCDTGGTSTRYEWIAGITIAGFDWPSSSDGGYADFTEHGPIALARGANAATFTPGFGSGSYTEHWRVWIDFDQDGELAQSELVFSGSSRTALDGTLEVPASAPSGSTRMRVAMRYGGAAAPCGTFTYGEVEDYTISIPEPDEPPLIPAYCNSSGTSATYEWIDRIVVGASSWTSGSNGGYIDHSGSSRADLTSRAGTVANLVPGFRSSAYTEHWRVWVDLDHDGMFSSDEELYAASSNAAVTANLVVPTDASVGLTRMRVSMRYGGIPGPCGSFTYGEVEDLEVYISH